MPRKFEINWFRMSHIEATFDEETKMMGLLIKPTKDPLPRVTVITKVTDLVMFQFALYSWKNFIYPSELLNWVILDPTGILPEDMKASLVSDARVRVSKVKKRYHDLIRYACDLPWIGDAHTERPNYAMLLDCGDVMFPDTLSIKFRALRDKECDCVLPNSLAYYDHLKNQSLVFKHFMALPSSGLYFKKVWWNGRNTEKAVGLPYIGNCISIGTPRLMARYMPSSTRFFNNFPPDVKTILKKLNHLLIEGVDEVKENN